MKRPDPSLEPDWDEDNIEHITTHGLWPDQIEELYYAEGPFPTIALEQEETWLHYRIPLLPLGRRRLGTLH